MQTQQRSSGAFVCDIATTGVVSDFLDDFTVDNVTQIGSLLCLQKTSYFFKVFSVLKAKNLYTNHPTISMFLCYNERYSITWCRKSPFPVLTDT